MLCLYPTLAAKNKDVVRMGHPGRVLNLWRPAAFVLATPHLHGFRVVLDLAVRRVKLQYALREIRNVGELQHGDRDVADCHG